MHKKNLTKKPSAYSTCVMERLNLIKYLFRGGNIYAIVTLSYCQTITVVAL